MRMSTAPVREKPVPTREKPSGPPQRRETPATPRTNPGDRPRRRQVPVRPPETQPVETPPPQRCEITGLHTA